MSRRSPSYEDDRGAGRDADRDRDREPREKETMPIGKDDAAFVLGKNGSTKKKIARVCGADLDLNENELVLEMYGEFCLLLLFFKRYLWLRLYSPIPSYVFTQKGDARQRKKARDYVQFVTQQRIGPVHIDLTTEGREDLVGDENA